VAGVIGLSAGLVLALVAGARRSDTAIERFVDGANAHEDLVISGIPGVFDFAAPDLDEVAALPGVTDSERAIVLAGAGRTEDDVLVDSSTVNFLADPSGRIGHELDRFKVLHGRLADPDDAHEVVVAFRAAEAFDLEVGSTIDVHLLDGEELGPIFGGQTTFDEVSMTDPRQRLDVVGIVVEAGGLAPPAPDDTTNIWLTPAAADEFGAVSLVQTLVVQLDEGAAGESAFLDDLERLGRGQPVLTVSTPADAAAADRGLRPIVRALFLTALLLVVVTTFVAGQVLSRQAASEAGDDPALRALGWTRRDLLRLRVAKAVRIGAGSAVVAVVVAVGLSPLFPLGLARIVEPDPGADIDAGVLVIGAVGVLVLATGLAGLMGWWDVRRTTARQVRRPSRLVGAVSRSGAPAPIAVGTSLAVQAGTTGSAAPVVSAGATVALGLGTVAAVLAFMGSLGHLTGTPELYGWNWDIELGQEFSSELDAGDIDWLRSDAAVEALAVGTTTSLTIGDGRIDAYAVDDELGAIEPSLLRGRRAETADEIVVSPDVGDIGEAVTISFAGESTPMEIVGHAAVPRAQAILTFAGLQQIASEVTRQTALVELRDGADQEAFIERAIAELDFTGQDVATPALPADLVNFGRVDAAPAAVAAAMSVVAVATLVHALVTTVRRRRGDLAVLRALGFTRRQVLGTVAWEAGIIVGAAALVAIPAGVAAGRWGWIFFADELKVISRPVVPVAALVGAAVAALVLAEVVAVAAGRWSAGRSTAATLRAE
jgi:hypothetical protein